MERETETERQRKTETDKEWHKKYFLERLCYVSMRCHALKVIYWIFGYIWISLQWAGDGNMEM